MSHKVPTIKQPKFDNRIYRLAYPLTGTDQGILKRGYMVWDKPVSGYSDRAYVHFLYNPATVSAAYTMGDANVTASLLAPNPNDNADLRVPLYQSASWSLLFDRTYELWGQYNPAGGPNQQIGNDFNNPAVVGVLSDIMQMRQFTGMSVGYTPNTSTAKGQTKPPADTFVTNQGILNLIDSYVYFGNTYNLSFYGYVNEWDFTITHFTQNMVPMRALVNISFTMLPTPRHQSNPRGTGTGNTNWGYPPGRIRKITPGADFTSVVSLRSGVSGR